MRSIKKKQASGKLQGLQKEGAFLCCTEKRTKEKTLFDFLSSSRARLSPARVRGEDQQSGKRQREGELHLILFARTSGSEKHSEGARPSFRWQKQKRSNPFGASGNPKTNSVYFFHRQMIYIGIIYTSLYFRCLCIYFGIISRFSFFSISHCSFSLNCIKENRERESRWILSPITNTHSYLLIEKKDLRHRLFLCSFFQIGGIPHIQGSSPQTPHPYDYAPF